MEITDLEQILQAWGRVKDFKQEGLITDTELNQAKALLIAKAKDLIAKM